LTVLALAAGVYGWRHHRTEHEIEAAVREATESGLRSSFDAAFTLLQKQDNTENLATQALLHSILALEHGSPKDQDQAKSDLEQLEKEKNENEETTIASAYLALSQGKIDLAKRKFSPLNRSKGVEAVHGQVRVSLASGDLRAAASSAKELIKR